MYLNSFVCLLKGHCQDLRGLAAHPSSPTFVTGGSDKVVRLWHADQHRVVWTNNKLVSVRLFVPKSLSQNIEIKHNAALFPNNPLVLPNLYLTGPHDL